MSFLYLFRFGTKSTLKPDGLDAIKEQNNGLKLLVILLVLINEDFGIKKDGSLSKSYLTSNQSMNITHSGSLKLFSLFFLQVRENESLLTLLKVSPEKNIFFVWSLLNFLWFSTFA